MSLAAFLQRLQTQDGGQCDSFVVQREQIVAGDDGVDPDGAEAVARRWGSGCRLDVAAEMEDDGLESATAREV